MGGGKCQEPSGALAVSGSGGRAAPQAGHPKKDDAGHLKEDGAEASSSSESPSERLPRAQHWLVVGGGRTGLVVRRGPSLKSQELAFRLRIGARVEQIALRGERLHYRRLSGDGPDFGWVSLSVKGAQLLTKAGKAPEGQPSDTWSAGAGMRRPGRASSPYRAPAPAAVISGGAASEVTSGGQQEPSPALPASPPEQLARLLPEPRGGGGAGDPAGPGASRGALTKKPSPSLDGDWDCSCDYHKNGRLVDLAMHIEGSKGYYRVGTENCHRLFDIASWREDFHVVVAFRWANTNGITGSGTWQATGDPQRRDGTSLLECQQLEGTWSQDGAQGTWSWSGQRRAKHLPPLSKCRRGDSRLERSGEADLAAPGPVPEMAQLVEAGPEGTYEVAVERVALRSKPNIDSKMLSGLKRGTRVRGTPCEVAGVPWLRVSSEAKHHCGEDQAWLLVDAARTALGLGLLLKRVAKPAVDEIVQTAVDEAEVVERPADEPGDRLAVEAQGLSMRAFGVRGSILASGVHAGSRLAIALETGKAKPPMAGYCLFEIAAEERAFRVEELAVAETLRHRGYAKRLMQWAILAAHGAGCQTLLLLSPVEMAGFFGKLGLEPSDGQASLPGVRCLQLRPSYCASLRRFELSAASKSEPRHLPQGGRVHHPFGGVQLVCLLASHVANEERLERFADLLASIAGQEPHGPPALFISWSAGSPQLRTRVRLLLTGAAVEMPELQAGEQEAPLSQFQHFAACLALADGALSKEGWVFFSDDDDLWHPGRYAEYLGAVAHVHRHGEMVTVVGKGHAIPCVSSELRTVSPRDVDRLLETGGCRLSGTETLQFNAAAGSAAHAGDHEPNSPPGPEYFDIALRVQPLRRFMRTTPPRLLANKFCDRHFLHRYYVPYEGRAHYFLPAGWLYFYSRVGGFTRSAASDYSGGASFGVSVGDTDRRLAAAFAGKEGLEFEQEDAAFLVAKLRASIEEMLMSKAAIRERSIRREILETVCNRAARRHFRGGDTSARGLGHVADLSLEVGLEVCSALGVRA